jgi:hypothetical protein
MIQRLLSSLLGVLLVAALFVFTSILVAIALTTGLLLTAWVWWRTRGHKPVQPVRHGRVIEGEYRIIDSK